MTLFDVVILSAAKDLLQPYHRASILPHSVIPTATDHRKAMIRGVEGPCVFIRNKRVPKIGPGAAFATTSPEKKEPSKSNRTGPQRSAKPSAFFRRFNCRAQLRPRPSLRDRTAHPQLLTRMRCRRNRRERPVITITSGAGLASLGASLNGTIILSSLSCSY